MKEMIGGVELRLDRVEFSYGAEPMRFDLTVRPSEILALMGPSGSGKSTLLHLVAGFEAPSAGRVLMAGADVTPLPPSRRPVSMVFQENNLFAHLTVEANVGLGRSPGLKLSAEDREDVRGAIERTGLGGKEKRQPAELSGGERQRVALSRVLVRERPVLLLDEPFASLGPALRQQMLDLVRGLHAEHRMTVVMVTHDPDDAAAIADRLAFVEAGTISALGPVGDMMSPSGPDAFRAYIGSRTAALPPASRHN